MIPVLAVGARHRAAVADLPLSARHAADPRGAIVVVDGNGRWIDLVRGAVGAGAVGIVVPDPAEATSDDLRDLAASCAIPIVIERPLLRADIVGDARVHAAAALMTVDSAAPAASLPRLARDAVGWARSLAGPLHVVHAARGLALLEARGGSAVTVSVAATRRPGSGWIRAAAIGDPLVEVEVEGSTARVITSTVAGSLVAPTRFESAARLALRRALAAVEDGALPADLIELADDTSLAVRLLTHDGHRRD